MLARDSDPRVRRKVAQNLNLDGKALVILAKDTDEYVRSYIQTHPNMVSDKDMQNENSPSVDSVTRISDINYPYTKSAYTFHNTRLSNMAHVDGMDISTRKMLARCSNNLDIIKQLSSDKLLTIRQAVASNPMTDADTLMKLALESNETIRMSVASNENATFDILNIVMLSN